MSADPKKNPGAATPGVIGGGFQLQPFAGNHTTAEKCFLGSLIVGGIELDLRAVLDEAMRVVASGDFSTPAHSTLYLAIRQQWDAGGMDSTLLAERLRNAGKLSEVGGVDYLIELAESVPTAVNAPHYARIVADQARIRRLADLGHRLLQRTAVDGVDALKLLADAHAEIEHIKAHAELDSDGGIGLICMADVQPEPVNWLWPGRFAIGKLSIVAGDPGLGKSFLTLDIAARVSKGISWPDSPMAENPAGAVLLLSAEDDPADTIRPRLDAAGADAARIMALATVKDRNGKPSPFDLTRDIPVLERTIAQIEGCRLVVIDPVTAYLGATDSHKNAEVRAVLARLSELAARHKVAVIAVSHLNKGAGPAMYRTMGSLAFVAAARAAWAVMKDKDDQTGRRRLILPVKNNLGDDETGLAYSLRDNGGGIPCVVWEAEAVTVKADEALAFDPKGKAGPTELDEAVEWLRKQFIGEPVAQKVIEQDGKANGFSSRTLRRASTKLGIIKEKEKGVEHGRWFWSMPGHPASDGSPAGPVGHVGHLEDSAEKAGDYQDGQGGQDDGGGYLCPEEGAA